MKIKVKQVVKYGGHSLSANGSVNFTLTTSYSELPKTIELMQLLNNDITIKSKTPGAKPKKLGMFRIKDIKVSGDGTSTIKFNGLNDYIEMDNLNMLPLSSDENKEFLIMAEAEVEIEEGEEGEDNDEE